MLETTLSGIVIVNTMSWKELVRFSPTYTNDVLWDRDECVKFWGQKVTVQGHSGITYAGTITVQAEAYSTQCLELYFLQCESKKIPPWDFLTFFPKRLGIFGPYFTCLLSVPIYVRIQIFIQLPATLTKLCHIKRDHHHILSFGKCNFWENFEHCYRWCCPSFD